MAELVAEVLRQRIVDGHLADGDLLPKQENLAREFGTSSASVREGLRILEGEGLVTVRRGRLGGAVVHAPASGSAAYLVGLVLESRGVRIKEVGAVIVDLEPICAGLCAERRDRRKTVVPELRAIHEQELASAGDRVEAAQYARRFHEILVQCCGRETMVVLLGVLGSIWSAHAEQSPTDGPAESARRKANTTRRLADHEKLIAFIDDGNAEAAAAAAREHLSRSTYLMTAGGEANRAIDAARLGRYVDSARHG
jgi:DNA-binding FadR family transcriptional regulator